LPFGRVFRTGITIVGLLVLMDERIGAKQGQDKYNQINDLTLDYGGLTTFLNILFLSNNFLRTKRF
jgi:hypothetical protein